MSNGPAPFGPWLRSVTTSTYSGSLAPPMVTDDRRPSNFVHRIDRADERELADGQVAPVERDVDRALTLLVALVRGELEARLGNVVGVVQVDRQLGPRSTLVVNGTDLEVRRVDANLEGDLMLVDRHLKRKKRLRPGMDCEPCDRDQQLVRRARRNDRREVGRGRPLDDACTGDRDVSRQTDTASGRRRAANWFAGQIPNGRCLELLALGRRHPERARSSTASAKTAEAR